MLNNIDKRVHQGLAGKLFQVLTKWGDLTSRPCNSATETDKGKLNNTRLEKAN